MDNEGEVILRKIPVDKLIDLLVEMYNQGVDYIDISGTQDEDQDNMVISFTRDYMTEEGQKNFKEDDSIDIADRLMNSKLSEEDLNDLI
jgi:hypothetical protein